MLKIIRLYYFILSNIFPKMAANEAFEMFQKVRKKDIRERELQFYDRASKYTIPFEKEDIDCFEFGKENKDLVILIHGWDSNAGSMYAFVDELLKRKKRVISLNLPGHASYKNSKTNLYECKKAVKAFYASLPKHEEISVISHSFGSAVSTYGLSELDLKVDKLIFLTSLNNIEDVFIDYKNTIGLNKKAYRILRKKADEVLGEELKDVLIEQKLTLVDFNYLHLIHDVNDKIIPFENTLRLNRAITNSSIQKYEGIGHYRMLWNKEVIEETMSYLS